MIPEDFLIRNIFSLEKDHKNSKICYEYDFGDSWLHEVSLEKILPAKSNVQYPICSAGKRACPPEDCGGAPGYYNLLRIIKNPKHPEHDSMMEWLEEDFDPEDFDPKGICFDDE